MYSCRRPRALLQSSLLNKLQDAVPVVAGHLEKLAGGRGFDVDYSSSSPVCSTATPSSLARSPYPSSTMVLVSAMVVARQSRPQLLASSQESKVFRVSKRSCDVVGGKSAGAGAVSEIDTADVVRYLVCVDISNKMRSNTELVCMYYEYMSSTLTIASSYSGRTRLE